MSDFHSACHSSQQDQKFDQLSLGQSSVLFWVLHLHGAFLVWVGEPGEVTAVMNQLHVAVPLPCSTSPTDVVTGSCVIGDVDALGYDMAQQLSRRFRSPVYLSVNLPAGSAQLRHPRRQFLLHQ
eukprot:Selendium_serpulae@DN4821_c0_g1_i2.p2